MESLGSPFLARRIGAGGRRKGPGGIAWGGGSRSLTRRYRARECPPLIVGRPLSESLIDWLESHAALCTSPRNSNSPLVSKWVGGIRHVHRHVECLIISIRLVSISRRRIQSDEAAERCTVETLRSKGN